MRATIEHEEEDESEREPQERSRTEHSAEPGKVIVLWDIENIAVPKTVSAYDIAQQVRCSFFSGFMEADFLVAGDAKNVPGAVIRTAIMRC